jgi:hypothetical protein
MPLSDKRALILRPDALAVFWSVLQGAGGPTRRDQAIVLEPPDSPEQLPIGWVDEQEGGRYRLHRSERTALFDHVAGPHVFHLPENNIMKINAIVSTMVFVVAGLPVTTLGATCKTDAPPNTECTLPVEQLRPTQFAVGSVAVTCKAQKLAEKSKKKLKRYLKSEKRRVPVVISPDGNFYMTDHHHLATALYRAISPEWGSKSKRLHLTILANYSYGETSWGEFWQAMKEENRSYDYDNKGTPNMNFALLPKEVAGLLNDPYRTLSRWVRESCGYVKEGKEQCDKIRTEHPHKAPYFMEFYWGNFFRQKLPLKTTNLVVCKSIPYSKTCLDNEVEQLKDIYDKAMTLAASSEAKAYFEAEGLKPWDYGFNPSGEHLKLDWGGYKDACEDPVSPGGSSDIIRASPTRAISD